jgi:hypothetical protein
MAEKQEALGLVEYRGKGGEFKTLPKFSNGELKKKMNSVQRSIHAKFLMMCEFEDTQSAIEAEMESRGMTIREYDGPTYKEFKLRKENK